MATSNLTNVASTNTDAFPNDCGYEFSCTNTCVINAVAKYADCTATAVNVYNSGFSLVGTANFSGDLATFGSPPSITSGSTYYVTIAATQRSYGAAGSFPKARTDISYTNTAYMVTPGVPGTMSTGIGEGCNVTDVQTTVTAGGTGRLLTTLNAG